MPLFAIEMIFCYNSLMEKGNSEKYWHSFFEVGIALKAVNGVLEVVGGLLLIFVKPEIIYNLFNFVSRYDFVEDTQEVIQNFILKTNPHLTQAAWLFSIIFLLSHGIVKLFLVINLWQKKLWAYPLAIAVFAAFCVYQIYRYTQTHSGGMIVLTVLDIIVIILTWHEYKYVKSLKA